MKKRKSNNVLSNGAFSNEYSQSLNWEYDPGVADGIADVISAAGGKTLADFGAGIGLYTKHLKRCSIKSYAFDGTPLIEKLTGNSVSLRDFSVPVEFKMTWDWVLGLDVGHYIPKEKTEVFVDNLCRHAQVGVIVAWKDEDVPNPLSPDALASLLDDRGFVDDAALGKTISRKAKMRRNRHRIKVFRRRST